MSEKVLCKKNDGFEDKITVNQSYAIVEKGVNSYLIKNDKGEHCWLGTVHFE